MKDVIGAIATEEFVGLKLKMYLFLVSNSSHHKKNKDCECKDVLFNNNCLRHSMNRIQSKNHKIETYETKKIPL